MKVVNKSVSFSVIIPMYNEEAGAEKCIEEVTRALREIPESDLIIINDGSVDSTLSVLKKLSQLHEFILISHQTNQGYGAALKTGIKEAIKRGSAFALFMDSDLTNDPTDIYRFRDYMLLDYDLIKATRYSHGGKNNVPLRRFYISYYGNIILRALLTGKQGATDISNGFRAIKTEVLSKIELNENDFSIIIEEYCKVIKHTQRIANIPVELSDRGAELRPTSFLYSPKVFLNYLKYPIRKFIGIL